MTSPLPRLKRARFRSGLSLLIALVGITLPSLLAAQTESESPRSQLPAKDAYIVKFDAGGAGNNASDGKPSGPGPLRLSYSDGTNVDIPKEKGRFGQGEKLLAQDSFSHIQLADDRQHIGWLAEYMMCAQSYPCAMELVIFRSGHKPTLIAPTYGVIWDWKFLKGGKQLVVQSGFPHGDDIGAYALHDTETGRERETFSVRDFPSWVQQLRSSGR